MQRTVWLVNLLDACRHVSSYLFSARVALTRSTVCFVS